MIDIYDSEALIKVYRMLNKKCEAIEHFIREHALYFGPNTVEYGAEDVCNNILDLMARKNQLINLKIIIDSAINKLTEKDKKVLFIKMHYTISMDELCAVLELKQRTAFRRLEQAYRNLCVVLNESKYIDKLEKIVHMEDWICSIREEIKIRRMAYKCSSVEL